MPKLSVKPVLYSVILFIIYLSCAEFEARAQKKPKNWLDWSALPALPDSLGLGGAFIGESNGALIVAGGSNFVRPPWEGGEKGFHQNIYVLEKTVEGAYAWQRAGELPNLVAYGAAVSTPEGVLCMGGTNGAENFDQVFLLRWNPVSREVEIDESFPSLPQGSAYLSAAITGNDVYVAGGKSNENDGKDGMKNFWSLHLPDRNAPAFQWKLLPAWPGAARYGSVLIAQSNGEHECIYLFSGKNGATTYLKDTWQYNPAEEESEKRWSQKSDLPRAAMGAPVTTFGQAHILVFSGSDGHDIERLPELKENYQFVEDVLAYHTITDTWIKAGEMPQGLVTSSAVWWDGQWVIPTGEIGPGRRTPEVYSIKVGEIASKSPFHWVDFLTLGLYLLLISGMGFYFSRKKDDTTNNYFLGEAVFPTGQPGSASWLRLSVLSVLSVLWLRLPNLLRPTGLTLPEPLPC